MAPKTDSGFCSQFGDFFFFPLCGLPFPEHFAVYFGPVLALFRQVPVPGAVFGCGCVFVGVPVHSDLPVNFTFSDQFHFTGKAALLVLQRLAFKFW